MCGGVREMFLSVYVFLACTYMRICLWPSCGHMPHPRAQVQEDPYFNCMFGEEWSGFHNIHNPAWY